MPWQNPPNSVGTNLGWIIDDPNQSGNLIFEANPDAPTDGSGNILANDSVVNCTNRSSVKTSLKLRYSVTDSSNTTQYYVQTGGIQNGHSTFLVIDPGVAAVVPATVTLEILAWDKNGGTEPVTPQASISVACPQVTLSEVSSVDIWEEAGNPHGPIAIAVAEVDGCYPLNVVNRCSQSIDVWINGGTSALTTVDPGNQTASPIPMSSGAGQWILGFSNGDDPSIVVRRPPMLSN